MWNIPTGSTLQKKRRKKIWRSTRSNETPMAGILNAGCAARRVIESGSGDLIETGIEKDLARFNQEEDSGRKKEEFAMSEKGKAKKRDEENRTVKPEAPKARGRKKTAKKEEADLF